MSEKKCPTCDHVLEPYTSSDSGFRSHDCVFILKTRIEKLERVIESLDERIIDISRLACFGGD